MARTPRSAPRRRARRDHQLIGAKRLHVQVEERRILRTALSDSLEVDRERMARLVHSDFATPGQPEPGDPSPPLLGDVLAERDDMAANDHLADTTQRRAHEDADM